MKAIATPVGFGVPNFVWTVNGLNAADGATIQPTVTVFRPNPAAPGGGVSSIESVALTCAISKRGAVLSLTAPELVGQVHITIGVVANDTFETPSWKVNASAGATIATETVNF